LRWLYVLALAGTLACARAPRGADAPAAPEEPKAPPRVLAVRAPEALTERIKEGPFFRWGVSRFENLRVEMGPDASGDAVVWIDRFPVSPDRLQGLPVAFENGTVAFAGARYPSVRALALRLPRAETPSWVVAGQDEDEAVWLASEVLFRLASTLTGQRMGRRGAPLDFDYLLRETPSMARSGRWVQKADGGWTVDPSSERDDFAEWDRAFAAMVPIPGERVSLLVAPGDRQRPELIRLAAELDRAAGTMGRSLAAPVTILVEPDYVAQGRHAGDIGPAVPGKRVDLHLVYHPDDLFAYRYALARTLLEKAGIGKDVPLALRRGAALWLSGDWYGRPYAEWLPTLAAAKVLPDAEEILAAEEPEDGSEVLWTPVAAGVVERLRGRDLKEKLKEASSERVGEILGGMRSEASSPGSFSRGEKGNRTPFLKGVSLAMMNSLEGGYHSPSVGRQLERLAGMGVNAVSLMPFASQPGPTRPELRYLNGSPGSETDIGLIHATRLARSRGFHVLYKPHLWVSGDSWPGEVQMTSEEDWARWWKSYRRYILHHAFLARWAGADLFCTGVELSKTIARPEWRALNADVRRFFPGAVTYAANWYNDLENVTFWDDLDYIGVDTYYPLSASPAAGRAELQQGAAGIAQRLEEASRRFGKPVLLTEVGFAAQKGAWVQPHSEGGEYSEEDQALAYEVLFASLGRPAWLSGSFVWKAFSDDGSDSGRFADFRFMGRKAESVVRDYYQR
jgi:hypothetical protein